MPEFTFSFVSKRSWLCSGSLILFNSYIIEESDVSIIVRSVLTTKKKKAFLWTLNCFSWCSFWNFIPEFLNVLILTIFTQYPFYTCVTFYLFSLILGYWISIHNFSALPFFVPIISSQEFVMPPWALSLNSTVGGVFIYFVE